MVDFTKIITSLIVVAMIGVGIFFSVNELSTNYNISKGAELNATLSNFTKNFESIKGTSTQVQNASLGTQASQISSSGFSSSNAITSLKLMWNFFEFITDFVNVLAVSIGIDANWVFGFFAIVTVVMTLLFLKAVFGVSP